MSFSTHYYRRNYTMNLNNKIKLIKMDRNQNPQAQKRKEEQLRAVKNGQNPLKGLGTWAKARTRQGNKSSVKKVLTVDYCKKGQLKTVIVVKGKNIKL